MREALLAMSLIVVGCGKVIEDQPDGPTGSDSGGDDAPVDQQQPLVQQLYLVSAVQLDFSQTSKISLEIVDLDTLTLVRNVDLGFAGMAAAVVSPDGATVYVADFANGEIRPIDTTTGVAGTAFVVPQTRDLAISADGSKLFATSGGKVVAIDVANGTQTPSPILGNGSANVTAINLGLSPDGQRLGVSTTSGGSNPSITLVRTANMSVEQDVPITTPVTGCAASPAAVAFKSNALLVSWDTNCDALYQVDVGTHTQLSGSIASGRDSGASFISQNKLVISNASNLVYSLKEDGNLVTMNTDTVTFTQNPLGDTPFSIGGTKDGTNLFAGVIHRFNGGGADTLTRIETANANITPDAYTLSIANQSIIEIQVVAVP